MHTTYLFMDSDCVTHSFYKANGCNSNAVEQTRIATDFIVCIFRLLLLMAVRNSRFYVDSSV